MAYRAAIAAILAALSVALFLPFKKGDQLAPAPGPAFHGRVEPPRSLIEVEERRGELLREEIVDVLPVPGLGQTVGVRQPSDVVTLRGSIVVVDSEGVEHAGEDGSMLFLCSAGDESLSSLEVVIQTGAWSCEIAPNALFRNWGLVLGGRSATTPFDRHNRASVPADRFLAIEARWPARSVLAVKCRETGVDLDEIQLVGRLPYPEGEGQHPGHFDPRFVLDSAGRSPIALPAWDSRHEEALTLFARSPGYAWGRIDIEPSIGGERLLTLVPGGDLLVTFRGEPVGQGSLLWIRSSGESKPVLELPLRHGSDVPIESLPAGPYQVSVHVGHWFENPIVLGTSDVDVVAGMPSTVIVTLGEAPAPQAASLRGKLVIPEAWHPVLPFLSFRLQGKALGGMQDSHSLVHSQMTRILDHPPTYEWRLPEIQAGRWKIQVANPPWGMMVDVLPTRESEILIEVPPPALVRLKVLESGTDLVADLDQLAWASYLPEATGWMATGVSRDPETGVFAFQATIGEILVTAHAKEHESFWETFEIHDGLNEFVTDVHGSIGVVIVLKDGSTVMPWSRDWGVSPERIDGGRAGGCGGLTSGRFTVEFPGLYRIAIPEIDGYLPVQPLEVEFKPGPHRTIEVALVRAH